jgi:hypothetical protein
MAITVIKIGEVVETREVVRQDAAPTVDEQSAEIRRLRALDLTKAEMAQRLGEYRTSHRQVLEKEIIKKHVILSDKQKSRTQEVVSALTSVRSQAVTKTASESIWTLEIEIGDHAHAHKVTIDLPSLLPSDYDPKKPFFIAHGNQTAIPIVFFRNRLFLPQRRPSSELEHSEIILRVKKAVYDEEAEFFGLHEAVVNIEAAIEFRRSGLKRDPIPEDVKLLVWARDGGACVRCGSKQNLHFDHIIPVAKGGGNSEANIQILCQPCNLQKSDKIGLL